ncbi:hypothetical protein GOODEAATRI_011601 [Goodea atripinnis]|uniref:Uncharacterized protein n=1 Tax=Goodea atripinnis TaxID=208336 RepID=A0ABV0MGZ6_9TELE
MWKSVISPKGFWWPVTNVHVLDQLMGESFAVIRHKALVVAFFWSTRCAKVGGVHFPEELPSVGAPSHVHFDEKLHDSVVMVTLEDDGNFMVKVG